MKCKLGRVGVLMGGPSTEREISLKSGKAVYQALKEQGLDVVPLDIRNNSSRKSPSAITTKSDFRPPLREGLGDPERSEGSRSGMRFTLSYTIKKIKRAKISCAFIALHGKFGEDGTMQRILESLHIPYTGSGVIASHLCLDKLASRRIFKHYNIPVPEYDILTRNSWKKRLKELTLKFPVVVKPSSQGSSIGITFVDKIRNLNRAINLAFNYDDTVIIEKYIKGKEITVGILEERPLPVVEIVPKMRFFNFQAKYVKGKSDYVVPAKLPKASYNRAQRVGQLAHKALGCRTFSRIDMILSRGTPFVLEVNSIPGLTSRSLLPMAAGACGIDFAQLCLKIVQSAVKR